MCICVCLPMCVREIATACRILYETCAIAEERVYPHVEGALSRICSSTQAEKASVDDKASKARPKRSLGVRR